MGLHSIYVLGAWFVMMTSVYFYRDPNYNTHLDANDEVSIILYYFIADIRAVQYHLKFAYHDTIVKVSWCSFEVNTAIWYHNTR